MLKFSCICTFLGKLLLSRRNFKGLRNLLIQPIVNQEYIQIKLGVVLYHGRQIPIFRPFPNTGDGPGGSGTTHGP